MFDMTYRPHPPEPPAEARRKRQQRPAAYLLAFLIFACALTASAPAGAAVIHVSGASANGEQALAAHCKAAVSTGARVCSAIDDSLPCPSEEAGGERIFQSDFVSGRSVASFARNSKPFHIGDGGRMLDESGEMDLHRDKLSNTIVAFQAGGESAPDKNLHGAASLLEFWEKSKSTRMDLEYNDAAPASADVRGAAAPGNVLIPLPAAAWSGLSMLGGMGVLAGIRRLRRKF